MEYTNDQIKDIATNELTPAQSTYVEQVNLNMQQNAEDVENTDDLVYVVKIMAFADKFKNLHWAAVNDSYHKRIDEFWNEIEDYKDATAENVQSIIGQFAPNSITEIDLPIGTDPLEVINELKLCVENWYHAHDNDIAYEGCRNMTANFIEAIHKYIYLFRLCK